MNSNDRQRPTPPGHTIWVLSYLSFSALAAHIICARNPDGPWDHLTGPAGFVGIALTWVVAGCVAWRAWGRPVAFHVTSISAAVAAAAVTRTTNQLGGSLDSTWTTISLLAVAAAAAGAAAAVAARYQQSGRQATSAYQPGDIIWTDVTYHDGSGSKDRPVVVVGRRGHQLVCVYATSQRHQAHRDSVMSIGTGSWDHRGRETFVDCRRTITVKPGDVRRHGGTLDDRTTRAVVSHWRRHRS